MNDEIFSLVTFESTHSAIKAEKTLEKEGLKIKIITVPTEISAGCGLSIRFNEEDLDKVKEIIKESAIEVSGYYSVKKNGFKKHIKQI